MQRPDDQAVRRAGAGAQPEPENRLLHSLPGVERARLIAELELVTLAPMQVLADVGHPLEHVYFPRTCILSMVRRMRDGTTVEAGVVGRDGMAGIAIAFGSTTASDAIVASVPGTCHRVTSAAFRQLLPNLPALGDLLDRYALTFMDQLGQTIACNSLHSIEQRCTRWLLTAHDSVGASELYLTHDVLARLLGVRRAGVTVAAIALQREKLVTYARGRVVVVDRPGLEAAACECYGIVRRRIDQLLGPDLLRR